MKRLLPAPESLPALAAQPKPVIKILPVDRTCMDRYFVKFKGAAFSAGWAHTAAKAKVDEWLSWQNPRAVLADMLRYVDIELVNSEPFRYFR